MRSLAETLEKSVGAREGHLRANALIEGDAHQNRGWILAQESVCGWVAGGHRGGGVGLRIGSATPHGGRGQAVESGRGGGDSGVAVPEEES